MDLGEKTAAAFLRRLELIRPCQEIETSNQDISCKIERTPLPPHEDRIGVKVAGMPTW